MSLIERSWTHGTAGSIDHFIELLELHTGQGELLELHKAMCDKYGNPQFGSGRAVYFSKVAVFKVPFNSNGFCANEVELCMLSSSELSLAKTRSAKARGIEILAMEKVEPVSPEEIRARQSFVPDFVYAIDCAQVGYNRRGKLVAYDYGDLL